MLHFQANEGFLPELKEFQFQNWYEENRIKKSWVPSRYLMESVVTEQKALNFDSWHFC